MFKHYRRIAAGNFLKHKGYSFMMLRSLFFACQAWAQGPQAAYYYNPATELTWAQCHIYQEGGSRQKIPFLPVVSQRFQRCPLGINNYNKDVSVDGILVFVGNGIVKKNVWNSYVQKRGDDISGDLDVAGKIVMFCYDFPDKLEQQFASEMPLTKRLAEAALRKAAAAVLFSYHEEYPFLKASYEKDSDLPNIPVITITKSSALNIFLSAGAAGEALFKEWETSGQPPESRELISGMQLKIKGSFDKVETANFHLRFRNEAIPKKEMQALAQANEKALAFLFGCFREDKALKWKKQFTVYFRDFDAKLFYTHHWGRGLSSDEGIFNVHRGGTPNFGLTVHEDMHTLAALNWGSSTSFLVEGIAKHAEALATAKDDNHLQSIHYLKAGKLFPLEKMIAFEIGAGGVETQVGYPAAGSFVGFLIATYGLPAFKNVYALEGRSADEKKKDGSWEQAFGKTLHELEKEWLQWLALRYQAEER